MNYENKLTIAFEGGRKLNIDEVIKQLRGNKRFKLKEPSGIPKVRDRHRLPEDVERFYTLCGGMECFWDYPEEYTSDDAEPMPIRILSPEEVVHANLSKFGEEYEDDISSDWYLIADAYNGDYLSVDCGQKRNGWCYQSFWETYAHKGNSPIIAKSLTELLVHLLEYQGDYFYWLDEDGAVGTFAGYGDAYQ